jgi:succinate dehydrogenase/fumarate reductase cytochrome b subunit
MLMNPPACDIHNSPLDKLLGREYYQTPFGEKYLVLVPLVVHTLAGITKRLFSPGIGNQKPLSQPRPMTSLLSSTGYLTLFLFLPVHYVTHRIYPAISDAPIHSFGPAELDYEFVKTGLQTWPLRSWFLYTGLVGCVALHSVEGISIITKTELGRIIVPKGWRRLASLLVGVPGLTGLYFISRETVWALAPSVESYVASFSRSAVYGIL